MLTSESDRRVNLSSSQNLHDTLRGACACYISSMQRDVLHFAAAKLQGGWSAGDFGKYLSRDTVEELVEKFDKFEPLVRVRILLSILTLENQTKHTLHDQLQKLIHAAREDKEEWVSITAKALGDFAVPLDFAAMLSGSAIVRDTVQDLKMRVASGDNAMYGPLEDPYLSRTLLGDCRKGPESALYHEHFVPREGIGGALPDLCNIAQAIAPSAAPLAVSGSAPPTPVHSPHHTAHIDTLAIPRDPGGHAPGSLGMLTKQHGVDDMFRPNRQSEPTTLQRHMPSLSGMTERKGVSRPVSVKLLDVSEVQKLHDIETRRKQALSPEASIFNSQHAGESLEAEEGELPAGAGENSYEEPQTKRVCLVHE